MSDDLPTMLRVRCTVGRSDERELVCRAADEIEKLREWQRARLETDDAVRALSPPEPTEDAVDAVALALCNARRIRNYFVPRASLTDNIPEDQAILREEARAAIAALSLQDHGWQGISTAPKDGRWIIARCNDHSQVFLVSWGRDRHDYLGWCSQTTAYGEGLFSPNGEWIPAPQPGAPMVAEDRSAP